MLIKLFVFLRKICRCKPAVLFYIYLPVFRAVRPDSESKKMIPIFSKFAVECDFSNTYESWNFLKKWDFFQKNPIFSSKSVNLLYHAYQMILFLENVFSALTARFCAKNQKIFKFGKVSKFDEEKNAFILWKNFSYKIGDRKICLW